MTSATESLPTENEVSHPISLRSPLEVIQHALNAKLAPAELKEYFDLYRTMRADESAQAYAEAMNACQSEMPSILRDAENSHTKSRYARFESLNEIIRPIYTRNGFSLSFGEEPLEKDSSVLRIYCLVRHKGGHIERVQGDFPRDGKGMKGNDNMTPLQGTGSTYSYARRYLAKNIFNLAETNEDQDGNDGPGPTINPEQIETLLHLIGQKGFDQTRFLKWCSALAKVEIKDLAELPEKFFTQAVGSLVRTKPVEKAGGK